MFLCKYSLIALSSWNTHSVCLSVCLIKSHSLFRSVSNSLYFFLFRILCLILWVRNLAWLSTSNNFIKVCLFIFPTLNVHLYIIILTASTSRYTVHRHQNINLSLLPSYLTDIVETQAATSEDRPCTFFFFIILGKHNES